ncbi:MAG: S8 family serine peptidase [Bacteroidetes bacterium]|nr:S8 family serine peptidase [Bacteroidota bacterium]
MKTPFLPVLLIFLLFPVFAFSPALIGNPARMETGLDKVYDEFNLSGEGVIVAVIERGIDYNHPDFQDENGDTRLAWLYDLVDDSGANDPDNPYDSGTIWSQDDINSALSSGSPDIPIDRFGHGTACTGIAAGNGSAVASDAFRGVAYNATLISVKVTQDYFPPFDDQPGQTGIFDPNNVSVALEFVADKAAEMGMPCVALINLGSIGGPTDGTSAICQAMDAFVDAGNVLVCGVGDDGGNDNRAAGNISQDETALLSFNKGEPGNLRLEIWYSGDDRLDISIERPNGDVEGPFSSPATNADADFQNPANINYYHRGADVDFSGATSNRRQVLIDFSGATGEYHLIIEGADITDGHFDASLNPSRTGNDNYFTTFVLPQASINDYSSAFKTISPGDYVVLNEWTDINGFFRDITGQGESGEIWYGSSEGPTHDGRLGIDFAAPGEVLFGAYSEDTWYAQFESSLVQGGGGFYGIQNAVSAAAPLTTGVIALMLEADPALSAEEIRNILQETAREDSFTGSTPNNTWGYGKLDAYKAVKQALGIVSTEDIAGDGHFIRLSPNPASDVLQYNLEIHPGDLESIYISDLNGRILQTLPLQLQSQMELGNIPVGTYRFTVKTKSGTYHKLFVKL